MSNHSKTIEHDPEEVPRRLRTLVKLATAAVFVVAGAFMLSVAVGLKWTIAHLPQSTLNLMLVGMVMFICGAWAGRWITLHEYAPEDLPAWWRYKWVDYAAFFKYAAYLIVLSPFAIFIVPVKAWRKARADGDNTLMCVQHAAAASVFGLMITLLAVMAIGIPTEIALGH